MRYRKEVSMRVEFPESLYGPLKRGVEIHGFGEGGNLATAVSRAFRNVLTRPGIFHKNPQYFNIFVGVNGSPPPTMGLCRECWAKEQEEVRLRAEKRAARVAAGLTSS
jgi:hypothetical protein